MNVHFLIIESSLIIAKGLAAIIDEQDGWKVIGIASSMSSAREQAQQSKPDVIICNPKFIELKQGINGRIVVFEGQIQTMVGLFYNYIPQLLLRQFEYYIEIEDSTTEIISALQRAVAPRREHNNVRDEDLLEEPTDNYELSDREREVLVLVAKGKMNKEIADELNISIHTVFSHRKNIARKTGIKSVAGLTVYALLNHLIKQE